MVPGLFPGMVATPPPQSADWSQPPTAYPRNYQQPRPVPGSTDDGRGVFFGVLFRSALAIVLFFVLHGIGLIVGGYGLYYAIQSMSRGHKYGIASLVVAGGSFLAILIGWVLRLQGGGGF